MLPFLCPAVCTSDVKNKVGRYDTNIKYVSHEPFLLFVVSERCLLSKNQLGATYSIRSIYRYFLLIRSSAKKKKKKKTKKKMMMMMMMMMMMSWSRG